MSFTGVADTIDYLQNWLELDTLLKIGALGVFLILGVIFLVVLLQTRSE